MGVCGSKSGVAQAETQAQVAEAASARPAVAPAKQAVLEFGSEKDAGLAANVDKKMSPKGVAPPRGIGVACRKGVKSSPTPNQDSWCMRIAPGDCSAFGVFDGHGTTGHLISHAVKSMLTREVARAATADADGVAGRVESGYRRAHESVRARERLGGVMSGTTATVVVHDARREKLVVSHVGDSKAVLLRRDRDGNRGLVAEELTEDHKPEVPEERARIMLAGGHVNFDGHCHRVAQRRHLGGLNMSRSLGDFASHALGVSEVPTVQVRDVSRDDVALIVASDGVWEVLSPEEAAAIVDRYPPSRAAEAAARLADEAMAVWMAETDGAVSDDITAVVAWLPGSGEDGAPRAYREDSSCSTVSPPPSEASWSTACSAATAASR